MSSVNVYADRDVLCAHGRWDASDGGVGDPADRLTFSVTETKLKGSVIEVAANHRELAIWHQRQNDVGDGRQTVGKGVRESGDAVEVLERKIVAHPNAF